MSEHIPVSNATFLTAIFREKRMHAYATSFKDDPSGDFTEKDRGRMWGGGELRNGGAKRIKDADERGLNTFVTISTFGAGEDGRVRRRKALCKATYLIVADDIAAGEEPGPGSKWANDGTLDLIYGLEPSYILETSPGNTQWGWILSEPEERGWLVDRIQERMIELGLAKDAKDPGMRGVTRYVRLPVGWNTKAKYGKDGFRCGMLTWQPEVQYSSEDLCAALDVDTTEPEGLVEVARRVVDLGKIEDPVLGYLNEEGLIKNEIPGKPGAFDMICPWIDEHSDRSDSGTAWFHAGYVDKGTGEQYTHGGFRCHHGHCEDRGRQDVIAWLEERGHDVRHVLNDFEEVVEEARGEIRKDARSEYLEALKAAGGEDEIRAVCRKVARDSDIDRIGRELIAQLVRDRLQDVLDAKFTLAEARKLIKPKPGKDRGAGEKDNVRALIRDHIFMEEDNAYYRQTDGAIMAREALNATYAHLDYGVRPETELPLTAAEAFNANKKKRVVTGQGWHPVEEPIVEIDGKRVANTYRGFTVGPKHGDVEDWLKLCKHIYGAQVERVLDHMAFTVQHPERKVRWQVLCYGDARIGKTMTVVPLLRIFGSAGYSIDAEEASDGWGDAWAQKKVVAIEEILQSENRKFYNAIKARLANDGTMLLNVKGKGKVAQENLFSVYIFSNHSDGLHLEAGDGKLLAIEARGFVNGTKEESEAFYRRLAQRINDRSILPAILAFLLERDLSEFNPGHPPEETEAYRKMMRESRADYQRWMYEQFEVGEGVFAQKLISIKDVKYALECDGYSRFSDRGIGRTLRELGYERYQGRRKIEGRMQNSKRYFVHSDERLGKLTARELFDWVSAEEKALERRKDEGFD